MPRPSLIQLLISAEGRLARLPFLLLGAALVGLLAMFDYGLPRGVVRAGVGPPFKAALFVAGACVLAKRFHDRGRAGWWSALPLFAFILAWPRPGGPVGWLSCAVLAVAAVELAVRPGERGFNRFGPRPGRTPC